MRIAICTQDEETAQALKEKLTEKIPSEKPKFIRIKEIDDLIRMLRLSEDKIDIFFWDIDYSILNEEIRRKIENVKKIGCIVFIARTYERLNECFLKKTKGFLKKPIVKDSNLDGTINNIKYMVEDFIPKIRYTNYDGEKKEIDIRNIEYIKAAGRCSQIVYNGKKILISQNIGTLEAQLKETEILRVHKSYMVNVSQIKNSNKKLIILKSGKKIPRGAKFFNGHIIEE